MIKPLPGYVLISPIEDELKSGDVYLPEQSKDKPMKGKVLSVGTVFGEKVPLQDYAAWLTFNPPVQKDQTVIYKKWTNQEVKHNGKTFLLVKFDELLGVIK